MAYQVLARKWRPHHFGEMIGQEYILRMLENALDQKRLHHAYLLTGTRGVGKTTIARILAKCLNCEKEISKTPCGDCHACQSIDQGTFLDLYEVDGASRTKVEDTRELLENVLYPPTSGRFKIYLIDEVHMLSMHSFNALLKTLEEPPPHVKFILATTDPKRLPITILSRCLQFHLRRVSPEKIAEHLAYICNQEAITYDSSALNILAKAADGSVRDALSLLDQAIAYCQDKINAAETKTMLGHVARDDLMPLLKALINQDGKALFDHLALLNERVPDFRQLLEELIAILHQIAIYQIVPPATTDDVFIKDMSQRLSKTDVQLYYQIALIGRRDLPLCPSSEQGFEMILLRMLAFQPELSMTSPKLAITLDEKTEPPPVTHHAESVINWRELLPKLELSGMAYALAANCKFESLIENKINLSLSHSHQPMLNAKLKERITEALTRHFKKNIQLMINITTEPLVTPVKEQQKEVADKISQVKQTVMSDDKIKKFIELYDATLEVSLL